MSHLIVCGLNYHSSPIAIRERFVIPDSCVSHALQGLSHYPSLIEAAILSTCNRTEVYAVVSDVQAGLKEIQAFFASAQSIADHGVLRPNFRLLRDDVALHLMRVASGLDSMVLGEGQIMAQVKAAHKAALESKTAGPILDHLFKLALTCGKRVRSETALGRRAVSISSAAVELAREQIGDLSRKKVTIIGAGKMAQICMKHLASGKKTPSISVVNRSAERLKSMPFSLCGAPSSIDGWDSRNETAAQSDLVIVATSARDHLLTIEEMTAARANRAQPCLVIDISVPRNVDPQIGHLEGVVLKHADDLKDIVERNIRQREQLVSEAEAVVFETLANFHDWQRARFVVPTITGLREKIEAIRQEALSYDSLPDQNASMSVDQCSGKGRVEEISRAIVNQILHHPTVQLKATNDYQVLKQQAEALRTLFNLDPLDEKGKPRGHADPAGKRVPSACR